MSTDEQSSVGQADIAVKKGKIASDNLTEAFRNIPKRERATVNDTGAPPKNTPSDIPYHYEIDLLKTYMKMASPPVNDNNGIGKQPFKGVFLCGGFGEGVLEHIYTKAGYSNQIYKIKSSKFESDKKLKVMDFNFIGDFTNYARWIGTAKKSYHKVLFVGLPSCSTRRAVVNSVLNQFDEKVRECVVKATGPSDIVVNSIMKKYNTIFNEQAALFNITELTDRLTSSINCDKLDRISTTVLGWTIAEIYGLQVFNTGTYNSDNLLTFLSEYEPASTKKQREYTSKLINNL